jgi:hypothetical protein
MSIKLKTFPRLLLRSVVASIYDVTMYFVLVFAIALFFGALLWLIFDAPLIVGVQCVVAIGAIVFIVRTFNDIYNFFAKNL